MAPKLVFLGSKSESSGDSKIERSTNTSGLVSALPHQNPHIAGISWGSLLRVAVSLWLVLPCVSGDSWSQGPHLDWAPDGPMAYDAPEGPHWPDLGDGSLASLGDLDESLADLLEPLVIPGPVGPGMGGSVVEPLDEGGTPPQTLATQPTHQTAVVGSTVVLPCR